MESTKSFLFPVVLVGLFTVSTATLGVSGIGNSKVVVPSAEIVAEGTLEFEPSLEYSIVNSDFSGSIGGRRRYSALGFRLTHGATKKLEWGLNMAFEDFRSTVPAEKNEAKIRDLSMGIKYLIWEYGKSTSGLAFQSGVTVPTSTPEGNTFYEVGLILSHSFSTKSSIDLDIVYEHGFAGTSAGHSDGGAANVGLGYMVTHKLQLILEFNGTYVYSGGTSAVVSATPGFTFEINDRALIAMGGHIPMVGIKTEKSFGLTLAYTFSF